MTGWKKVSDYGEPPIGAHCRRHGADGLIEWLHQSTGYKNHPDTEWFVPELPADDDIEPPPAPTIPPDPIAEKARAMARGCVGVGHVYLHDIARDLDARWWQPMDTLPESGSVIVTPIHESLSWVESIGRVRLRSDLLAWCALPPHPFKGDTNAES